MKYFLTCFTVFSLLITSCTKDIESDSEKIQQQNAQIQDYILTKGLPAHPTGSGLYLVDDTIGKGATPGDNDYVLVEYNAYTLDDKLFDTTDSILGNQNNIFPLNALYGPLRISMKINLSGWVETFKHMKEGGKATAIMPASMAALNNYVPRRYDFTLVKVIPDIVSYEKQLISDYLQKFNKTSKDSTNDGYYILSQTEGTGAAVNTGNRVYIQYTGKLLTGKVFEKTRAGYDFTFSVGGNQVLPVLDAAVKQMKKGGNLSILIPYNHGYGSSFMLNDRKQIVIPGYSSLIFQMTLEDVK